VRYASHAIVLFGSCRQATDQITFSAIASSAPLACAERAITHARTFFSQLAPINLSKKVALPPFGSEQAEFQYKKPETIK
jgi:hypothetical protein